MPRLHDIAASGVPLVVEPVPGLVYLAAVVVETADGVAWADPGWDWGPSSGHPFHALLGPVQGDGPWTCGGGTIRALGPDDPDDDRRRWAEVPEGYHAEARARVEPLLRQLLADRAAEASDLAV